METEGRQKPDMVAVGFCPNQFSSTLIKTTAILNKGIYLAWQSQSALTKQVKKTSVKTQKPLM